MNVSYADYTKGLHEAVHDVYHNRAELLPGLKDLLDRLYDRQPIGIASSSEKPWIETCLKRHGITHYFQSISTPGDTGGIAKPDPAVYLHAAASLNTPPSDCTAIEDSRNGIRSAKAAGMRCIAIRTEMNPEQDLEEADEVTHGLKPIIEILTKK